MANKLQFYSHCLKLECLVEISEKGTPLLLSTSLTTNQRLFILGPKELASDSRDT